MFQKNHRRTSTVNSGSASEMVRLHTMPPKEIQKWSTPDLKQFGPNNCGNNLVPVLRRLWGSVRQELCGLPNGMGQYSLCTQTVLWARNPRQGQRKPLTVSSTSSSITVQGPRTPCDRALCNENQLVSVGEPPASKERTYPELVQGGRCRFVLLGLEVGGPTLLPRGLPC